MNKKKLDYSRMLRTWVRRLWKDPTVFSSNIGVTLTEGSYISLAQRSMMTEAMAVWAAINPQSAFYGVVENRLRKKATETKVSFDQGLFVNARDAQVKSLLSRLPEVLCNNTNEYVCVLCMYLLLPAHVARKWLWYENVDFQSVECLLRRMTKEQFESLKHHYDLVQSGVQAKKLPCFTKGVINKVWGLFNPSFVEQDRMATKAAIAYDFFGMSMGFKLYSEVTKDDQAPQELASQFLSKRKRDSGDFEVNKEHGGVYWLLYRLLRSNSLYNEGDEVRLGRWVCPGFWVTIILWGILVLASPASLVAALGLYFMNGVTSWTLLGVGAITPVILGAIGIKKACGRTYTGDYWKGVWIALLVTTLTVLAYLATEFLKNFPSFYVGIASLVFLVPYCVEKETGAFWQAPIMGKLFPFLFLGVLGWDIHTHSNFFMECWFTVTGIAGWIWSTILDILGAIWGARYTVLGGLFGIALYAGLLVGLFRLNDWAVKKTDAMIEAGDKRVYTYQGVFNGAVAILGIAMLGLLGLTYMQFELLSTRAFMSVVIAVALPFLLLVGLGVTVRSVTTRTGDRVAALTLNRSFYDGQYKAVFRAISSNHFWTEVAHAEARAKSLDRILSKASGFGDERFQWLLAIVRSVKNDDELNNVTKFFLSHDSLCRELWLEVSPQLLDLIFSGESEDVLREAFEKEKLRQQEEARLRGPALPQRLQTWATENLIPFLEKVEAVIIATWLFLSWPIRALLKGVKDAYRMWEAFQEECPASPPHERPLAQ